MKNINKLTNGLDPENSIFLSQIKSLDDKLHLKYDNSDSTIAELFRRADEKIHLRYPNLDSNTVYNIVKNYNGEYEAVSSLNFAEWLSDPKLNTTYGYALYANLWYPVEVSSIDNNTTYLSFMMEKDFPYDFAKITNISRPIGPPNPTYNPNHDSAKVYILTITLENQGGYVVDLILYNKAISPDVVKPPVTE